MQAATNNTCFHFTTAPLLSATNTQKNLPSTASILLKATATAIVRVSQILCLFLMSFRPSWRFRQRTDQPQAEASASRNPEKDVGHVSNLPPRLKRLCALMWTTSEPQLT